MKKMGEVYLFLAPLIFFWKAYQDDDTYNIHGYSMEHDKPINYVIMKQFLVQKLKLPHDNNRFLVSAKLT